MSGFQNIASFLTEKTTKPKPISISRNFECGSAQRAICDSFDWLFVLRVAFNDPQLKAASLHSFDVYI